MIISWVSDSVIIPINMANWLSLPPRVTWVDGSSQNSSADIDGESPPCVSLMKKDDGSLREVRKHDF